MNRLIVISLILVGLFFGCKKYEDGPLISFRSAEKRIYGTYRLKQYTVDGVDSLNLFNDSLYNVFEFFDGEKYGYDALNGCIIDGKRDDGNNTHLSWVWELNDNKTIIKVTESAVYAGASEWHSGTGPFSHGALPEWEILRLTKDDLKMKTTYNGKEYLIEL